MQIPTFTFTQAITAASVAACIYLFVDSWLLQRKVNKTLDGIVKATRDKEARDSRMSIADRESGWPVWKGCGGPSILSPEAIRSGCIFAHTHGTGVYQKCSGCGLIDPNWPMFCCKGSKAGHDPECPGAKLAAKRERAITLSRVFEAPYGTPYGKQQPIPGTADDIHANRQWIPLPYDPSKEGL